MRRRGRLSGLLLLAGLASCGQQEGGTYVHLRFNGVVAPGAAIATIAVNLQFGTDGPTAATSFQAPAGAAITLPTDAVLEIRSGSGLLNVNARALASDGITVLGTGSGSRTVVRDQTVEIPITFAAPPADAGVDGPQGLDGPRPGLDASGDLPGVDVPREGPPDLPLVADGPGGVDAAGLDAGDGALDAAADFPGAGGAGGTGGSDALGAGGMLDTGGVIGSGGAPGTDAGSEVGGAFQLTATPTPLNFGDVLVNTTSLPVTVTIANIGSAPTPTLTTAVVDAVHFLLYRDNCMGAVLGPGATCTVAYTFKPTQTGLVLTDGWVGPTAASAAKFTLVGNGSSGTSPLAITPATTDFGVVDVNTSGVVDLTVTNNGSTDLGTITLQPIGSSAFRVTNNRCATSTLPAGGRCLFTLAFSPTAFGPASVVINAQAPGGASASASATGTGRDFVPLTLQFAGTGNGTVTGAPQACASPSVCTLSIARTDPANLPTFNLSAQPDGLSVFGGFGDDCVGNGACVVVMSAPRQVTTTFNPRMVTLNLTVLSIGGHQGSLVSDDGTITCNGSCPNLQHAATNSFTIEAKPTGGSTFAAWTVAPCLGLVPKCSFALTDNVTIVATFGPPSYGFVSSSTVIPGKLGGVDAADSECARLAGNAGLPGRYSAWLSSSTAKAQGRIGEGGWLRTDGRPFAADLKSLTDPSRMTVYYPPRLDERGHDVGNGVHTLVATGSNSDGSGAGDYCKDYTDTAGSLVMGDATSGAYAWSNYLLDAAGCATARHLYCFRSDVAAGVVNPPPQPGRRVFVSSNPFVIKDGLAPDELCWKDAEAAGISDPKTFVAFIATAGTPALKLVKTAGLPWKRMDDVFITQLPTDLGGGRMLAPIDATADGKGYVSGAVWTGATDPTTAGTATCGDWKGGGNLAAGLVGDAATTTTPPWFDLTSAPCDNLTTRLYCIEP